MTGEGCYKGFPYQNFYISPKAHGLSTLNDFAANDQPYSNEPYSRKHANTLVMLYKIKNDYVSVDHPRLTHA